LQRKLDAIRRAAADLSDRFADQSIREKYIILEEKFSTAASTPPVEDAKKQSLDTIEPDGGNSQRRS
jgi:hypothetical protein